MGILEEAQARIDARPAPRRIDYERMNRIHPGQKAALTRAENKVKAARKAYEDGYRADPVPLRAAQEALATLCKKTVTEWNECGAWPDDWSRWQRALDDALGWMSNIRLEDL